MVSHHPFNFLIYAFFFVFLNTSAEGSAIQKATNAFQGLKGKTLGHRGLGQGDIVIAKHRSAAPSGSGTSSPLLDSSAKTYHENSVPSILEAVRRSDGAELDIKLSNRVENSSDLLVAHGLKFRNGIKLPQASGKKHFVSMKQFYKGEVQRPQINGQFYPPKLGELFEALKAGRVYKDPKFLQIEVKVSTNELFSLPYLWGVRPFRKQSKTKAQARLDTLKSYVEREAADLRKKNVHVMLTTMVPKYSDYLSTLSYPRAANAAQGSARRSASSSTAVVQHGIAGEPSIIAIGPIQSSWQWHSNLRKRVQKFKDAQKNKLPQEQSNLVIVAPAKKLLDKKQSGLNAQAQAWQGEGHALFAYKVKPAQEEALKGKEINIIKDLVSKKLKVE